MQFNNFDDVSELRDIYIRKFVIINYHISPSIYCDAFDLINAYCEPDYINAVIKSFGGNEYHAYHYLAISFQYWRMENKYKVKVPVNYNNYYDLNLLNNAVHRLLV
jgi:hypothetical protein